MALLASLAPWLSTFDTPLVENLEDHPFFNLDSSFFREANIGRANRADVIETEKEYTIEIETPGYQKPEISIEFSSDRKSVTIKGKRESQFEEEVEGKEKEPKPKGLGKKVAKALRKGEKKKDESEEYPKYWISEREVDEFSRTFNFESALDVDKAAATLEQGVLTIVVPKAGVTRMETKRITIA